MQKQRTSSASRVFVMPRIITNSRQEQGTGAVLPAPVTCAYLIDADVVNFHSLRPDTLVDAFRAAPGAADRDVEKKMKGLVEWPLAVVGRGVCETLVFEGEILLLVDVAADLFRR